MVAPSFAAFDKITEPFYENGKYFIKVRNPKTKTERKVRWYTDAEYAKAYGNKLTSDHTNGFEGLKHARGFDNGPILVIRGNKVSDEGWLKRSCARYAVGIGWYIASTDTLPFDYPSHFKFLLLGWNEFRNGDERHAKKPADISNLLLQKAKANQWVCF